MFKDPIEVNGSTVEECIHNLVTQFPDIRKMLVGEDGNVLPYVNVFLNDETIYPDELTQPVKDNDNIFLLYLIGGG